MTCRQLRYGHHWGHSPALDPRHWAAPQIFEASISTDIDLLSRKSDVIPNSRC